MMRSFLSYLKQSWFKIAAHRPSLQEACLLSLMLHGLLLLVLSGLLSLFEVPSLYKPPLVFDYVFAPVEEIGLNTQTREAMNPAEKHQVKGQQERREENAQQPAAVKATPPRPETPAESRSAAPPSVANLERESRRAPRDAHPSSEMGDDPFALESGEESYVPAEPEPARDRPYFLHAVESLSFVAPHSAASAPNPVTAKISLTRRQSKMLLKRFKKWSENFTRLKLTDSTLVWRDKGREYAARFHYRPARSSTAMDEVVVEVSTEESGYKLATEMRMKRLAFSNFAQFVDYWDPWVAVHDDELDGRFHSNTEINVRQSNGIKPKFRGKVTTSSYEINTSGSPFLDEKSVFLGGLETGVKAINLPKHFLPFESDTTIDDEQIQRFDYETRVVFRGDGTFSWEVLNGSGDRGRRKLPKKAFYIIGTKGRSLHVKGVVRGKVLVYSPSKIVIDDDLTYAHHPEVSLDADDYLGLVSGKDIEIGSPATTGPGDLYIFASIYARGRFRVKDRRGDNDATIYIYGSLTAGSLSATEPRYATHVRFDKRLERNRPPNFPMTDRFEVTDWNQKWEVKGN